MLFRKKVEKPGLAFGIYFVIAAILASYGIVAGTAVILSFLAGLLIYKLMKSPT